MCCGMVSGLSVPLQDSAVSGIDWGTVWKEKRGLPGTRCHCLGLFRLLGRGWHCIRTGQDTLGLLWDCLRAFLRGLAGNELREARERPGTRKTVVN